MNVPSKVGDEAVIIIALDIGSSSIRCTAYKYLRDNNNDEHNDDDFVVLASSRRPRRSIQENGQILLDGLFDDIDALMDEIHTSLASTCTESHPIHVVAAIGITSFVMNLIGVDVHSKPIMNPAATLSYACQSKQVDEELVKLKRYFGPEQLHAIYQRTGAPLHSAYAIGQLLAFYHQHPDLSTQVHNWQSIGNIVLSRWFGRNTSRIPLSYSEASWTGLLDFRNGQYDNDLLNCLPVECRKALPKLADFTGITKSTITTHGNDNPDDQNHHSNYDDIHNEWLQRGMPSQCDDIHIGKDEKDTMLVVKNPYHERWPIFRNVRYFLSVGDGACANLGTKCTSAQNIAVTVGTSAAARICLSLPIGSIDSFSDESTKSITIPPGLFCYRIDARHVLVGGALTDGGSVLEWLSHLLKLDNQEMNKCLEDARNLLPKRYDESLSSAVSETVMIPFLSGERSTGFRTGATGVLMGLTRATTSAHLVESALVGITLRLSAILRLLLSVIEQIQNDARDDTPIRILASGKALEENALWRQMLADAAALTVILDCSTREGTSRGVAVLLRSVLSQSEQYESDRVDDTIKATPQANSRLFWDNALQKQEQLLDALTPFF